MNKLTSIDSEQNTIDYIGGKPVLVVKCPSCSKSVVWMQAPYKPFCSKRCKLVDLGGWVNETHRIPGNANAEEQDTVGA